jgi:hypothetical protein
MSKYICEFCKGEFAKASNLSKHQRTAKYCIDLQDEKTERDSQLTCEYCNKVLSRSDSLHRHYMSCIEYLIYQRVQVYDTEISSLKERLAEKDQQLQEMKERLWSITDTSLTKTTNSYTHIGQVTINEAPAKSPAEDDPTAYPLAHPPMRNQDEVTELINKLHRRVVNVISNTPPLLTQK